MGVENPLKLEALVVDMAQQGIGRVRRRGAGVRVEIEHRIDDGAAFGLGIGNDVLNARRALLEEPFDEGPSRKRSVNLDQPFSVLLLRL